MATTRAPETRPATSFADGPTVLLVGAGEPLVAGLVRSLTKLGVSCEQAAAHAAAVATLTAAPDLVVLIGDAAADGGAQVLASLAASATTAVVPVAVLADHAGPSAMLDELRHGVVAVVPRDRGVVQIARRVHELATEVPERTGEVVGELGERELDQIVELASELRTGILTVTAGENVSQVLIQPDEPRGAALERLASQLQPLVAGTQSPLRFEFLESPSVLLSLSQIVSGDTSALAHRRILLIERNPARADLLAHGLRAGGALVGVSDGEGTALARLGVLDPEVIVVPLHGAESWALPALRQVRRDSRLRWASLVVLNDLWSGDDPDLARLSASVTSALAGDAELSARARSESSFDLRLEALGPSRTLRALVASGKSVHVSAVHARASVNIDLGHGLVIGATAKVAGSEAAVGGPSALATWLALRSARVHVEEKAAPVVANLMSPIDDALEAATREDPPLKPSVAPPAAVARPHAESAERIKPEKLVHKLADAGSRLRHSAMPKAEPSAPVAVAIPRPAKAPKTARLEPRHKPTSTSSTASEAPLAEPTSAEAPLAEPTPAEPTPAEPTPAEPTPAEPTLTEPTLAAPTPAEPTLAEPTPAEPALAEPWRAGPQPTEDTGTAPPSKQPAVALPEPERARVHDLPTLRPPATSQDAAPTAARAATPAIRNDQSRAFDEHAAEPAAEPWVTRPKRVSPIAWVAVAGAAVLGVGIAAFVLLRSADREVAAAGPTELASAPRQAAPATQRVEVPVEPPRPVVTPPAAAAPPEEIMPAPEPAPAPEGELAPSAVEPASGGASNEPAAAATGEASATPSPAEQAASEIDTLIRTANSHRAQGRFPQAEQTYLIVLNRDTRNARALAGLSRVAMERRDWRSAVLWARRLTEVRPSSAGNHVLLGDAHAAAGNRAMAESAWRQALAVDPRNRVARERLASR